MKIRNKINFSYIAIFVIVASAVGIGVIVYTENLVKKNIYAYLHSSSRARAEHIRTFIQDQEQEAVILAAASVYRDFLKESRESEQFPVIKGKIDKRFARTLEADPKIYEVFILDKDGKVLASSDKKQEGVDKSTDDYFLKAKDTVFFKDIYFSSTLNKLTYAISAPIKDDNGDFLGVSVLQFLPNAFFSIVENENGLGATEENFLINQDKFFISPSHFLGAEVILKEKVQTKNANDCYDPSEVDYVKKNGYHNLANNFGSQLMEAKDYRNMDVLATHAYIPETDWCLITKADRADLFSFQRTLVILFLAIFIFSGLVFLLVGLIISRKITKELGILLLGTKKIIEGDLDYQIKIKAKDEIGELSDSFNQMGSSLKKLHDEQEKKIAERTEKLSKSEKDLQEKLADIERTNQLMVGRELEMIKLKEKIRSLEKE